MDLCDIREIKALLARHGFHFSKSMGQNFLIQSWVPRDIAAASGAGPGGGGVGDRAGHRPPHGPAGRAGGQGGGGGAGPLPAPRAGRDHGRPRQCGDRPRGHPEAGRPRPGGREAGRADPHRLRQPALQHHHPRAYRSAGGPLLRLHHGDDPAGGGPTDLRCPRDTRLRGLLGLLSGPRRDGAALRRAPRLLPPRSQGDLLGAAAHPPAPAGGDRGRGLLFPDGPGGLRPAAQDPAQRPGGSLRRAVPQGGAGRTAGRLRPAARRAGGSGWASRSLPPWPGPSVRRIRRPGETGPERPDPAICGAVLH